MIRKTFKDGFKYYPGAVIGHIATGFITGFLWWTLVPPLLITTLYVSYQFAGYIKKGDSVMLDLKDFIVGMYPGLMLSPLWLLLLLVVL